MITKIHEGRGPTENLTLTNKDYRISLIVCSEKTIDQFIYWLTVLLAGETKPNKRAEYSQSRFVVLSNNICL